ncbi:MAG: putative DNA binding domain-containing protein [Succinivibrio sp.]|nr:putative DNA binding domain-containing protein [Succinivibrio sp.]
MKESSTLEYREKISSTFLKTACAFANYGTGRIVFGVDYLGQVRGIADPVAACLDLERRLNGSIEPVPDYTLEVNHKNSLITLTISEGPRKPYLYKAKAYKRNDTATVEVDPVELRRLILQGRHFTFEELPATAQDLKFSFLSQKLQKELNLQLSQDIFKTWELFNDEVGFNQAAELLADNNSFPGIEAVRFGESTSNILYSRALFDHESLLKQYDDVLDMYRQYYQHEQINGSLRECISTIPEEAFRDAVINALVHRQWDLPGSIQVTMFPDRIEVVSPGGLPLGENEHLYRTGGLSILRNRIVSNVFFRLRLFENLGAGIPRICECYRDSAAKPVFNLDVDSVKVTLPLISSQAGLTADEQKVLSDLKGRSLPSSAVAAATGFGKSKTVAILKRLVTQGYVRSSGNGRGLRYTAQ